MQFRKLNKLMTNLQARNGVIIMPAAMKHLDPRTFD